MSDQSVTRRIEGLIARMAAGDPAARDELIRTACERLERLTRKMLRGFPALARWEQTADVFQNSVLRLCRALSAVTPGGAREFFALAAVQVRRELLDLSRHHFGPQGAAARHDSARGGTGDSAPTRRPDVRDPADARDEPVGLAVWTEFHRQVDALPAELREVFDLLFYQGLTHEQAAEVLGVAAKTVQRRWASARVRLYEALQGEMPDL